MKEEEGGIKGGSKKKKEEGPPYKKGLMFKNRTERQNDIHKRDL